MQLWVGLGNPGPAHAQQRDNIGFRAADAIADAHGFAAPRKQFAGWTRDGRVGKARVLILKPATYMNESGRSVADALRFHKLGVDALTVLHDELDLIPFKVKVRVGGGLAGHNGLRSIDRHFGPAFRRVRLGSGHPGPKARVLGYVLGDFAKAEREPLAAMLDAVAAEATWLADGDGARFMNQVALRLQG